MVPSQVVPRSQCPVWSEQFDLHTYPDQSKVLEISLFARDEIGRCSLNLNDLSKERTHEIWTQLEGCGALLLIISISGTLGSETISDLKTYDNTDLQRKYANKYVSLLSLSIFIDISIFNLLIKSLMKSFQDIGDIGILVVKGESHSALCCVCLTD